VIQKELDRRTDSIKKSGRSMPRRKKTSLIWRKLFCRQEIKDPPRSAWPRGNPPQARSHFLLPHMAQKMLAKEMPDLQVKEVRIGDAWTEAPGELGMGFQKS
jgi:hypothetical protein